ncbi:MAG: RES family NAD+ phosphorylase [Proteobacteria bacterium]|nr:RES family NAD+ phosphorylase [Pseudomonadota bacterium]
MSFTEVQVSHPVHRLIPSRFPPVLLFDWADSEEELEEIAALEGITNDRIKTEYGDISLVAKEDWVGGPGSTPLMAAFTHPGNSRFADGTYGVYYAANNLETAVAETKFHREIFLKASNEAACLIQMREYISKVNKKLVDLFNEKYNHLLQTDINQYATSQDFGRQARIQKLWGLYYPSVRNISGKCVAIFRPPALTIPVQGCHLDYIWDGHKISEVRVSASWP